MNALTKLLIAVLLLLSVSVAMLACDSFGSESNENSDLSVTESGEGGASETGSETESVSATESETESESESTTESGMLGDRGNLNTPEFSDSPIIRV